MHSQKEYENPILVLEDSFLTGTLMRYRYNTLAVLRSALKCGFVVAFCLLVLTFLVYIYGLVANLNPELDFPLILRSVLSFSCLAACYSVVAECHPQCLTMTSKNISLEYSNNPFIRKPLQEIKDIEILYHSGTKLALKIYWLKGHGSPWVVAGTVSEATLDDPVAIVESILNPEKLSQFTGPLSMRWKTQRQLQLAGWHPGRDVEGYINQEMNEHAQKALREFGGLQVSCIPLGAGTLIFEPPEDDEFKEDIRYFSDKSRLKLSFIGVCDGGDYVPVVVSQYGYVYLMAGDEMRGIGTSVSMAIDRLIGGKREVDVLASKQLGEYKRDDLPPPENPSPDIDHE